jgi:hypothetical protein
MNESLFRTVTVSADMLVSSCSGPSFLIVPSVDFVVNGFTGRFELGVYDAALPSRKAHNGPLTTELQASLMEQATVIALYNSIPKPRITLNVGDLIEVEGHGVFRIVGPQSRLYQHGPQLEIAAAFA